MTKLIFSSSLVLFQAAAGWAQVTLTLTNSFIDAYRRRVTITSPFTVHHAKEQINSIGEGSKDGDLHIAGMASAAGLPMVAEIMNARKALDAVAFVRANEASGQELMMQGVWRIWFEHPGQSQTQFEPFTYEEGDTNPDHMFEIHPVTAVWNNDLRYDLVNTLVPIRSPSREFKYKDAKNAFDRMDSIRFSMSSSGGSTTLSGGQIGYNYIEFKAAKREDAMYDVGDGSFLFVTIHDLNGVRLKSRRRIAVVKGSEAETRFKSAAVGEQVQVVGIPRISLSLVEYRRTRPHTWEWRLPYELVIVAVK